MSETLPDGWNARFLFEFLDGQSLFCDGDWVESKDQDEEGDNRLIQLADIGDGVFLDKSSRHMNDDQFEMLRCTELVPQDILIARMPEPLGRACLFPGLNQRCATVVDVAILRKPKKAVNETWLFYSINSEYVRRQIETRSAGTTRTRISRRLLRELEFLTPTELEQKKIASILQTVDEVIEKTDALIEKYEQIKTGMMHDLFTRGLTADGKLRPPHEEAPDLYQETPIGWIPKEWEPVSLDNELRITHGNAFDGLYFSDRPPGEILLVPGNFHRKGGLSFENNTKYYTGPVPNGFKLKNGDLLVVMTDLSPRTLILGRFAVLDSAHAVLHNQRIGKVLLVEQSRWDKDFLHSALNTEPLRQKIVREATGTTVRHTSPTKILSNSIARPTLDEQSMVAAAIGSIQTKIKQEQQSLSKLSLLKSGLMHDLLTGKIIVKFDHPGVAGV